jgi:TolB-like protein/class 3 adenylate cyclase
MRLTRSAPKYQSSQRNPQAPGLPLVEPIEIKRRLAAIFAADVEGYSRLMGADEVGTLDALTAHREILDGLIATHGGRIANTAGDSVLAEFGSAVDAVRCAIEAQGALAKANSTLLETRHVNFRIGVHVGDVMVRAGDLFGDGVNIAARLQTLARAGGLCISGVTYDQVRKILPLEFTDLGAQTVKNIEEPIRAYEVSGLGSDAHLGSREVPAPRLSIVVLPFANIGGDPEQEYFVDGVTESLTTDLSRIRGSFVIGRHTAFTYKGKAVDLKQIGRDLNVGYVLEGSVRRGGNRIRVNVQLVDAETGTHLWTDRFDKPVADLFEMQDEVTARIAIALNAPLIEAEARRGERSLQPDALDFYFQGQNYLNQGVTPKYIALARRFFEQALALDPENISALVGIANVELLDVTNLMVDDRGSRLAQAEATLIKVLSMAPRHALAHLMLAGLQLFTNRAALAIRECEQALELDRNLAYAHAMLGFGKVFIGRGAESESHIQQAFHLSPRDINACRWMHLLGVVKLILGADTEAVEWLRRSLEANRNYPFAHFQLAAALALVGSVEEARATALAGFALDPEFTIRRTKGLSLSSDPIFRAGIKRIREGMLMAGIPEE